jgi:hypothetical protein
MEFIRRVYSSLLLLFPGEYREEFGEELQIVFELSLQEAAIQGGFEVGRLIVRELVSLPKAVFLEYLREWRSAAMKRSFDSYFDFVSGSWKEFLAALLPFFIIGGLIPLLNYMGGAGIASNAVRTVIMLASFGAFLLLLALGVKRRASRWYMPYLGLLFAILSVYLFSMIFGTPLYLLFRGLRDQSLFLVDILWDGIFWYGLLTAILVLAVASRTFPAFHSFRDDWTQLCFLLYGAVPFALWLTFDEYAGDEPYMLLAFLVLGVGAWLYLRSNSIWFRFGALFVAMTFTMVIAAAGKGILAPGQDWPFTIDQGLVISEVKHTITLWGWFAVGMLIPLGIRFLL